MSGASEPSRGNAPGGGWRWFCAWSVIGTTYSCALILLVFGLLIVPIVGLAAFFVASKSRLWPELVGLAQGPAATALMIAYFSQGPRSCPAGATCGGPDLDARPWLVAGCVLAVASAVAYALLARRERLMAPTSPVGDKSTSTSTPAQTSSKAMASLIVGFAGVAAPLVLPMVALVLGGAARRDIRAKPGLGGSRLALAGVLLGLAAPMVAFGLFYAWVSLGV